MEVVRWRPNPCGGPILTLRGARSCMIAADKILADFGLRLWRCSDFIAAEGGQIVILRHFSHWPITIGGQITHNNGGRHH